MFNPNKAISKMLKSSSKPLSNMIGDFDKDKVINIMDCAPRNSKRHGGQLIWQEMKKKGIRFDLSERTDPVLIDHIKKTDVRFLSKKEKKVVRGIYENRPELLEKSRGLHILAGTGDQTAYVTKSYKDKPRHPGEEVLIMSEQTLKEDPGNISEQVRVRKKVVGKGMDYSGSVMAHELEHREQYIKYPRSAHEEHQQKLNELIRKVRAGEMTVEEAELEYEKLPLEKPAFEVQSAPRERDIKVSQEKVEETFRRVI